MKASWWEKPGLLLMDGAMLSKSLILFSVDGRSCVPSLLFDLRPNYGGGNEDDGDLLQKVQGMHCYTLYPWPCSRPLPTHASAGDFWTRTGKSGSVYCGATAPFSWVLVRTRFCLSPNIWLGVNSVKAHTRTFTTRFCFLGLCTLHTPRFSTTSLS